MKTLIVTLEYPPQIGGIASYIFNVASHLPPADVLVLAPQVKSQDFDKNYPWRTIRVNPYWFFWPKWGRLFFQTRRLILREKIQLLHVHHVLPVGYVAYLLKKLYKLPYYIFLHGTDLEAATATRGKSVKFFRVIKSADKIVVNSRFMKQKLLSKFPALEDNRITILYPSPADFFFGEVPTELIEKRRAQLALEGKKVILTVARMTDGKGYPHLLRLLPQLLQKIPNLVWLIIGDGPKKDEIIAQVQKNNLQNNVRFLGQIVYADLPLYFHLADAFVLLTHKDEMAEEGWGTVFLEAAACGLPVVAGRVGGVEEVVEHLKTGFLVDTYQDQSVLAAISDLLVQKDLAESMGRAGQERTRLNFRWADQLKKLYV